MCIPTCRVSAAKSIKKFLGNAQRYVTPSDLDVQQHDIQVIEEIEIDMNDIEQKRCVTTSWNEADSGNVASSEDPHRRPRISRVTKPIHTTLTIEKSLYVREKCNELVVVAFMEIRRTPGVLVDLFAPWRGGIGIVQDLPGMYSTAPVLQPKRPQQDLPKLSHDRSIEFRQGHVRGTVYGLQHATSVDMLGASTPVLGRGHSPATRDNALRRPQEAT